MSEEQLSPMDANGPADHWFAVLHRQAVEVWGRQRAEAIEPALRRTAASLQRIAQERPRPETEPYGGESAQQDHGTVIGQESRRAEGAPLPAPMATVSQPYELDVCQAASAIKAGRLTARALVDSLLERIASIEPSLQAWTYVDATGARAQADALASGDRHGALAGVPIGLKDIYDVAGMPTEAGSSLYAGHVAARDADCVAQLRAAGAIMLGKTETTQFALGDPAPTRNPWHPDHTPGGSSSGSAAAVTARMVPAALGTQTAGSVLRPAAYCGIVGFKPSAGRFSRSGIIPLGWSLDHPGTLTRSVADARLLFSLLDQQGSDRAITLGPSPRLGLLRGRFLDRAEPQTLEQFDATCGRLTRAGALVRDVSLPDDFDLALSVHQLIMWSEAATFHAINHAEQPDAYRPLLRAAIEAGSLIPAAAYLQAQRLRTELTEAATALFDGVDCLLLPSAPSVAPLGLESTGDASFNAPWSLFGFPALALPTGLSAAGLPHSLQITGRAGADDLVLAVATWCEGRLDPMPAPPLPWTN